MMWHDWNSITAATAEMHCKLTVWNTVCDNTPILTLLNSVFDDHCDNINVVHECMTIKAVCVDYGEKTFLFSPKYVSNCTCHCLDSWPEVSCLYHACLSVLWYNQLCLSSSLNLWLSKTSFHFQMALLYSREGNFLALFVVCFGFFSFFFFCGEGWWWFCFF